MKKINLNKTKNYVKRFNRSLPKKRIFLPTVLMSFLLSIVILAIGFVVVWHYRANVFSYFAREYMKEIEMAGNNNSASSLASSVSNQAILSQESLVVNAVKKGNPAVVSIVVSQNVPKYILDPSTGGNNPFGDMFPGFNFPGFNFGVPQYKQNGTQKRDVGSGSGFFVSADGLIVTNKHVVDQQGADYTVFTNDGNKHTAKIVAKDPVLDIALIKIDGSGYSYLDLGNSESLQVGQSVIAIGNALGEFRNTVSVGVVSGLARSITAGDMSGNSETLDHVIQTDAAINPGNSGGPLIDLSGRVIGVNVAIAQGSQNIGFALPINSVKSAIDSVKNTGKIVRAYLGVRYVVIDEQMKNTNNLTVDYGVLVKAGQNQNELAVVPGSPADKAGIVENDIILEVNGQKLDDNMSLASIVRQKNVGDVITLKILHKGVEKTVQVTLESAPTN